MRRVKVLFVIDNFRDPQAGTEGQFFNLVSGLDSRVFEPHVLFFKKSKWVECNGFPVTYSVLGHDSLKSVSTWVSLFLYAYKLKRQGFGLAHVFFGDPSVICPPIFSLFGIKTIISRRDMGYWYTPLLKSLLRLNRHIVSRVVSNSEAVKMVTHKSELYDLDKISVIYNGYENTIGYDRVEIPLYTNLTRLRKSGRVLIVLVANIRPIKRIGDAIEALASLNSDFDSLDLFIVGSGEHKELCRHADRFGVDDRVHFLGKCNNVKPLLELFDVAVLCSESEGFSNAIVEYLQAGLPVICSDVGGNSEAVIDGYNGYLFKMGDITEFSAKLRLLVKDSKLRSRMGKNARLDSLVKYSMTQMVRSHEALYLAELGI